MAHVRGILFDVDGTLLDSREAWMASFDAGLAAIRRTSIPAGVSAQWIGTPIEVIYADRCGLSGDELSKAIGAFQKEEGERAPRLRPFPGVREVVGALDRWKLAAVTNKRQATAVTSLRAAELLPLIPIVVGGDSVPRKKPAPDPIVKAAAALGLSTGECAVVGDTEVDVRAAKEAKARSIGVLWGYGTRERLEAAGVDHLIETPEALPPLLRALTPSTAA